MTAGRPPEIADALAAKRRVPDGAFGHFGGDADLTAGVGNREPATVLDKKGFLWPG